MSGPKGHDFEDTESFFKKHNVEIKPALDDGFVTRLDDDGTETIEKDVKFPPLPIAYREWDNDRDNRYAGDLTKIHSRVQHKLYKFWLMWVRLRTCLPLEELLMREEEDKESDAYLAKNVIVDMLDEIAKTLIDTDLPEEIIALFDADLTQKE